DAEDARRAAALGVDAVGVVLVEGSARAVSLAGALAVRQALPPFVALVAVLRDPPPALVTEVVARLAPDWLQFHGDEPGDFCAAFGRPYLKAVAAGAGIDWASLLAGHPRAAGFVADSHAPGGLGGTGRTLDWSRLAPPHPRPLVLAGGLSCENVAAAIRAARPFAVDVASGIESAPGRKCPRRMQA
ncbi:MAG: phosphoribosylanthranilate isomerase, partial [Myxococcota bacterium]|nr:phosphoribosylanthranilate isomerase [Myxococcota bacterium]